ncbi:MAG: FAD-dependent oxidoreductase [Acidobacteriota bacterium]|nr:FAD-dependent oxidoreductase [Acidobacteriota bacterium]
MIAAERREIVIAGGGFAGSILARALHAQGRDVLLLERGRHPRFALGESSTPLANLALERLAVRYGFEDLWDLAAHGRWRRRLPEVGRGLKRGFCFYENEPGEAFSPGPASGRRLVVAASPDDEAADSQWLRADVDRFLFERARAEGVDCREEAAVEVVSVPREPGGGPVRLRAGGQAVEAGLLIDATGGSPLAAGLGAGEASPRLRTSLVYSHFAGVAPFERAEGWPDSPFPERWSASHHLLEEGWMYQLRFDDGSVSAGFLLTGDPVGEPEAVFASLLDRYPSLAVQFADSAPLRPVASRSAVAWRRDRAAGRGWLLLPHSYAFVDPMFSTGIAWSLLAVERVADFCRNGLPAAADLERYGGLVAAEADHIDRLLVAAYRLMPAMDRFTAAAMVYFAAASFDELRQRLLDAPREGWCRQGFLGAGDGRRRLFEELEERSAAGAESGSPADWVGPAIERWNLIGLLDPRRCNAYPVDLEDMERRAVRIAAGLGLDAAELRRRWPRLRSPDRMMEPV